MKTIKFKPLWSDVIAQFDAAVRCEIYGATVAYYLEGIIPDGMSDLARGAFAFIKADIDASRRRAEQARATRLARVAATQSGQSTQPAQSDRSDRSDPSDQSPQSPRPACSPKPPTRRLRSVPRPQPTAASRRIKFNRAIERRIRRLNYH